MGVYVTTGSLGGLLGPLAGGLVTQMAGWRTTFWLLALAATVPFVVACLTIEDSRGRRQPLDLVGMLLVGAAAFGLNLALINGSHALSGIDIGLVTMCVLSIVALIAWESRRPAPMLDLRQLARGAFLGNTVASTAGWFAIFAVDVFTSLYLQRVVGLGAITAGLALAAPGLSCGLTSLTAGAAARRWGRDRVLAASVAGMSLLLIPWVVAGVGWPLWAIVIILAAWGTPMGYVLGLSAAGAMGGIRPERAGASAAAFNTLRQIGSSLGVALPAAVLSWSAGSRTPRRRWSWSTSRSTTTTTLSTLDAVRGNCGGPEKPGRVRWQRSHVEGR